MIFRIASAEGDPDYDIYLIAEDDKFTHDRAKKTIDRAIRRVKAADPENYEFIDLIHELPEGIYNASIFGVDENW